VARAREGRAGPRAPGTPGRAPLAPDRHLGSARAAWRGGGDGRRAPCSVPRGSSRCRPCAWRLPAPRRTDAPCAYTSRGPDGIGCRDMACARVPRFRRPRLLRPAAPPPWRSAFRGNVAVVVVALALVILPSHLGKQALATSHRKPEVIPSARTDTVPPIAAEAPKPLRGQKQAPCIPGVEVEATGFCWIEGKAHPPNCPSPSIPTADKCLIPVPAQTRVPTSVDDQGGP